MEFCENDLDSELINRFSPGGVGTCEKLKEKADTKNGCLVIDLQQLIELKYVTGKNAIKLSDTNPNMSFKGCLEFDKDVVIKKEIVCEEDCDFKPNETKTPIEDGISVLKRNFMNYLDEEKSEIKEIIFEQIDSEEGVIVSEEGSKNKIYARVDAGTIYISSIDKIYAPSDSSRLFKDFINLTKIYFGNFDTSRVIDMRAMFYNCYSLTELDLTNFNTSKVTNMWDMFRYATKLEKITFGEKFNTSNVTNMTHMFSDNESIVELDLSNFNTDNVEYMDAMFYNCSSLKKLNLKNFNTQKVSSNIASIFVNSNNLEQICYDNSKASLISSYIPADVNLICD